MSERGDATVEFLGILVVLVIPVLYIVLAVGHVSAGAMAADAGAREAARILAEDVERQGTRSTRCPSSSRISGWRPSPLCPPRVRRATPLRR